MCNTKKITDALDRITAAIEKQNPPHKHTLRTPLGPFKEKESEMASIDIAVNLGDHQQFNIGPVTAHDAAGNPTALGGPVVFSVDDATIATVTPDSADPTSALVVATGKLGSCVVSVTDGVETENIDIAVAAEAESGLGVPVSVPIEQP